MFCILLILGIFFNFICSIFEIVFKFIIGLYVIVGNIVNICLLSK